MDKTFFKIFENKSFIDCVIYQCGFEQCEPSHSFGPAIRQHYLFHYVISGKGTLYSTDSSGIAKKYTIEKNQGFLIYPNQCNHYIADFSDPWEYIWVEFDGLKVSEYLTLSGLSFNNPLYTPNLNEGFSVKQELINILESSHKDSFISIAHLYLFLAALKNSSSCKIKAVEENLKDFYIREAINYIEKNYQNNITIEDISHFCNLNRSYFGKIFKEHMNSSPQEFLIQYRMVKACEFLRTTNLSIKEIGEKVGYENQLHFSRAFKNTYGHSPKNWKLKNQFKS